MVPVDRYGPHAQKERVTKPLVAKLKEFKEHSFLKRTALLAISFGASNEKMKELGAAFTAIDVNNDGLIDLSEFTAVSCCCRAARAVQRHTTRARILAAAQQHMIARSTVRSSESTVCWRCSRSAVRLYNFTTGV